MAETGTGTGTGANLKKQRSEQRRLLAIEERRKQFKHKSKILIPKSTGTHTVFESDSDVDMSHSEILMQEGRTGEKRTQVLMSDKRLNGAYTNKVTGKMADEWLGFDGTSSDDDMGSGEDDLIPLRPQFEGKRGEVLMKLQQRVGQDRRFRVTRAFLDERESENEDKTQSDEEDDFEKEKNMSLAVLQSVVGSSMSKAGVPKNKSRINKQEISMKRFDPQDAKCTELEVRQQDMYKTEDVQPVKQSDTRQVVTKCPIVSNERFFQVNSDLRFSGDAQSHKFSFLEMKKPTEDVEIDATGLSSSQEGSSKKQRRMLNQQVSSSDEESETNQQAVLEDKGDEIVDGTVGADGGFFFFFDNSGDLRGRLASGVRQFMRTKSLEEIETTWKLNRKTLTQDYKKKRKDALRRIRKSNTNTRHFTYKA